MTQARTSYTTIPNFGHAEIKLNRFYRNRAAVPIQLQRRTCSSRFVRPSIPAVPPRDPSAGSIVPPPDLRLPTQLFVRDLKGRAVQEHNARMAAASH
jgi:hypothetical protein